jgi:cell wall-associated NlpC family hydrolase
VPDIHGTDRRIVVRCSRLHGAWLILIVLALSGCASATSVARPAPFPGSLPEPGGRPVDAAIAATVLATALSLQGIPYRLGGELPASGLDCSGLVRHVFLQAGIRVPRTVAEQFDVGIRIRASDIQPADLVFFDTIQPGPSHVGIMIDRARFIHAPGTGSAVRIEGLAGSYWTRRFRGARRVVPPETR